MMETAREAFTRELGSGERRRGLGWRLRSAAAGQPLATMPNQHALDVPRLSWFCDRPALNAPSLS